MRAVRIIASKHIKMKSGTYDELMEYIGNVLVASVPILISGFIMILEFQSRTSFFTAFACADIFLVFFSIIGSIIMPYCIGIKAKATKLNKILNIFTAFAALIALALYVYFRESDTALGVWSYVLFLTWCIIVCLGGLKILIGNIEIG